MSCRTTRPDAVADADGRVSFTWKDHCQHGSTKVMTLAADEFIRRYA